MSDPVHVERVVVPKPAPKKTKFPWGKARAGLWGLCIGLVAGAWIGGGPDRYGEADGVVGGIWGAGRSLARGGHYLSATLRDCVSSDASAVRRLGLNQQIETRLWQDKRLEAAGIIVQIEADGTAVLKGIVPDEEHKDRAVTLARDTRGVEQVVDELAIRPSTRTIDAGSSAAVPTGVATSDRVVR